MCSQVLKRSTNDTLNYLGFIYLVQLCTHNPCKVNLSSDIQYPQHFCSTLNILGFKYRIYETGEVTVIHFEMLFKGVSFVHFCLSRLHFNKTLLHAEGDHWSLMCHYRNKINFKETIWLLSNEKKVDRKYVTKIFIRMLNGNVTYWSKTIIVHLYQGGTFWHFCDYIWIKKVPTFNIHLLQLYTLVCSIYWYMTKLGVNDMYILIHCITDV